MLARAIGRDPDKAPEGPGATPGPPPFNEQPPPTDASEPPPPSSDQQPSSGGSGSGARERISVAHARATPGAHPAAAAAVHAADLHARRPGGLVAHVEDQREAHRPATTGTEQQLA